MRLKSGESPRGPQKIECGVLASWMLAKSSEAAAIKVHVATAFVEDLNERIPDIKEMIPSLELEGDAFVHVFGSKMLRGSQR